MPVRMSAAYAGKAHGQGPAVDAGPPPELPGSVRGSVSAIDALLEPGPHLRFDPAASRPRAVTQPQALREATLGLEALDVLRAVRDHLLELTLR